MVSGADGQVQVVKAAIAKTRRDIAPLYGSRLKAIAEKLLGGDLPLDRADPGVLHCLGFKT